MLTPIPIAEIGIGATTTVKGMCHVRQFSVFAVLFTISSFHFLSSSFYVSHCLVAFPTF